jgi:outer membrane protein assembly factor BamB
MRTLALLTLIIIAFQANAQKLTKVWSTPQTLKVPESVLYNAELEVAFVACMGDEQNEKTGDGYIAKINLEGNIISDKWLEGLNDPKGMAINDGKLYVSDMNELVVIDIENAAIDTAYLIPDASFLNDVTICKNGVVFVSDSHEQNIYALQDSTFSLWLDDPRLEGVNGLWATGGNLYAGNNSVWAIDPETKSIAELFSGAGGIDGLETIGHRNFIFSNWGGRIYISDNGKVIKLLDTSEVEINTADIDYVPGENLVLVPTFFTNRVDAYELDMNAEIEEE